MQTSVADVKKIQELVSEFLAKLNVSAKPRVFAVEEYIKIEIDGADSSLLIGYHGETLRALKHVLASAIRKQVAEDAVVLVDVSDYLGRKEKRILDLAKKAVAKYRKTKKPIELPNMNAYERRIAHSYISDEGLSSESVGEGFDRHIVVQG